MLGAEGAEAYRHLSLGFGDQSWRVDILGRSPNVPRRGERIRSQEDAPASPRRKIIAQFEAIPLLDGGEWHNAVTAGASGHFWIAGDQGTILRSSDDGETFERLITGSDEDRYDIHFYDAALGLAVGHAGTALLTRDGGDTWTDVSLGDDRYLGAVRFVSATRALVFGERGLALTLDLCRRGAFAWLARRFKPADDYRAQVNACDKFP